MARIPEERKRYPKRSHTNLVYALHRIVIAFIANFQRLFNNTELSGTFEVDYTKGQVKIDNRNSGVYYGIFEINENTKNPTLLIEYQKDTYPTSFSEKALKYISRPAIPRRQAAQQMGMLEK